MEEYNTIVAGMWICESFEVFNPFFKSDVLYCMLLNFSFVLSAFIFVQINLKYYFLVLLAP